MNNEPILNKSLTDWTRLDTMTDEDIDLSDCPEVTPAMLKSAKVRRGLKSRSESSFSPEQIAQRKAARKELAARCWPIFAKLRLELMETHYNWFIAIDPDRGHYILEPTLEELITKIRQQYPDETTQLTTYRINETGVCGTI